MKRPNLACLVVAAISFLAATPSRACSIPVFRYALDRWHADPYRLELTAGLAQNESLAAFTRNLAADSPLNLEVTTRPPGDANTPAHLRFPHGESSAAPVVWSGTLDADALGRLTNSPARRELVRRILDGHSVVWVLVESGVREADDALALRVEKRLKFIESVARLPVIDPNDPTSKLGPGPALRVKFSLLRISGALVSDPARSKPAQPNAGSETGAPAETLLRKMLAGPKPAAELAQGPWLAPVFGRGRVLGAWPAANFGDEEIEEACLFLLGACSCQVKRQNPGWDLLLAVDWEKELQAASTAATTPGATGETAPAKANSVVQPETVTISSGSEATPQPGDATSHPWLLTIAGVCLLLGLALALRHHHGQQ